MLAVVRSLRTGRTLRQNTLRCSPSSQTRNFSNNETHKDLEHAKSLVDSCKYKEASALLDEILAKTPYDSVALVNKAMCICQIHDQKVQADVMSKKAVDISYDNPYEIMRRSFVLCEIGRADLAVLEMTKLTKTHPGLWESHYWLGRSLNKNWKRYSAAILSYEKALQLKNNDADTCYFDGEARYWLGMEGAFNWLNDTKNLNGPHEAYYRGLKSFRQGSYDEALDHFEHANGWRGHDDADVRGWIGETCLIKGSYSQAIEHFDKAIASAPTYGWSLYSKSKALKNLGKEKESIEFHNKSLEVDRFFMRTDYFRHHLFE